MPRTIALTVEPDVAQMMPGERLAIAITIQNSGLGDERYHIGVIGLPYAWYDLDTPAVELAPAAGERVSLVLHPAGDDVMTARYPFKVQVAADSDPAHVAAAVVNLMVVDGAVAGLAAPAREETVATVPRPESTMEQPHDEAEPPRSEVGAVRVPLRLSPRTAVSAALVLALLAYTVITILPGAGGSGAATPAPTPTVLARVAGLTHRITLGAPAVPRPEVLLNPAELDFGRQSLITTSDARLVHVANLGLAPLTITHIAVAGRNASDFAAQAPCLGMPIAVDAGCAISVRFTPTAAGARAARLVISSNAPHSPHAVALSGRA